LNCLLLDLNLTLVFTVSYSMGLLCVGAHVRAVSRGAARVFQSPEIRHRVRATETCRGRPQGL
jgi:hypothetical protein